MKHFALALILALSFSACVPPPPNLTPQAVSAFNKTRVIKALDLVRDTAIAANAEVPSVISTDDTRKIVTAHESLLKIMDATDSGWQPTVKTTLDELVKNLSAKEQPIVQPYVLLVENILVEITK